LVAFACATESNQIEPPGNGGGSGNTSGSGSGATSGNGGTGLTSGTGGSSSSGGKGGTGNSAFGGSAGVGGSGNGGTTGGTSSSGGTAGTSGGSSGAGGTTTGGTGGTSGGSAGSGGTGGVPQDVIDAADVVAHTKNDKTTASSSEIFFHFYLENQSDDPLPMANVEVRYWFDPDGVTPQVAKYYQAASIQGQTVAFQEAGANSYVKMTFTGNTITKGADLSASEFQLQITGGTFDQSDDWSWTASGTRAPNDKVTVYLDGTLVWGCEPTGACFDDVAGTAGGGGT
jgi:hypothetical protein